MKKKRKNVLRWLPSVTVGLLISLSAFMKLASIPPIVEIYSRMGIVEYIKILGGAELIFIAAFLVPRTMKFGFLFLTAYFGGAMAVELSHGNVFFFPALLLSLIWIAAFIRDPSIFKSSQTQTRTLPVRA